MVGKDVCCGSGPVLASLDACGGSTDGCRVMYTRTHSAVGAWGWVGGASSVATEAEGATVRVEAIRSEMGRSASAHINRVMRPSSAERALFGVHVW